MYRWNLERVKIAVKCWLCGNLQQHDAYLYSRYAPSCPCTASLPAGWVRNLGPISVSVTRTIQIVFPVVKLGGEQAREENRYFSGNHLHVITSASRKLNKQILSRVLCHSPLEAKTSNHHGPHKADSPQVHRRQGSPQAAGHQGCSQVSTRHRRSEEASQVSFAEGEHPAQDGLVAMLELKSGLVCYQ